VCELGVRGPDVSEQGSTQGSSPTEFCSNFKSAKISLWKLCPLLQFRRLLRNTAVPHPSPLPPLPPPCPSRAVIRSLHHAQTVRVPFVTTPRSVAQTSSPTCGLVLCWERSVTFRLSSFELNFGSMRLGWTWLM